jgi:hypothetical protein
MKRHLRSGATPDADKGMTCRLSPPTGARKGIRAHIVRNTSD